jgi:hypothetical protein
MSGLYLRKWSSQRHLKYLANMEIRLRLYGKNCLEVVSILYHFVSIVSQSTADTVAKGFVWPQPTSDSETWRYITFQVLQSYIEVEKLQRIEDMIAGSCRQKLIDSCKSHSADVVEKICDAFSRISVGFSKKEVQNLVDQSCSVALEFGVQRCRLELFSPQAEEVVQMSKDQYEDLNYGNNEGISRGTVLLPIRSGLKRTGDGQGRTFDQISNLRPAGIYLRAGGA